MEMSCANDKRGNSMTKHQAHVKVEGIMDAFDAMRASIDHIAVIIVHNPSCDESVTH